jgi:hypothetical protein
MVYQLFYCRNTTDTDDFVQGYKHIVATINGFSQQLVDFSDNPEELETLISIVSEMSQNCITCLHRILPDQQTGWRSTDE